MDTPAAEVDIDEALVLRLLRVQHADDNPPQAAIAAHTLDQVLLGRQT
jgi:hypothetical protein